LRIKITVFRNLSSMCLYHTLTFIQKPPPKKGIPLYKTPPVRNQEPNNQELLLVIITDYQ